MWMVRKTMTTRTPGSANSQAAASARPGDDCAPRRIRGPVSAGLRAALAAAAALTVLAAGSASVTAETPGKQPALWPHRPGRIAANPVRRTGMPVDLPSGKIAGPGSKSTKALFAEVHRAYRHVPAIELEVIQRRSTFHVPRRFVLILRSGRVVAEEFTRAGHGGTTLVARRFQRTYSRTAGARCWRRLPASNPETLADVGMPFPYPRVGIKVLPPKATSSGWKVMSENRAEFWFLALQPKRPAHLLDHNHLPLKRFITYAINAKSHMLRSIYIQQPTRGQQNTWPTAMLKATALAAAPRLPRPTRAC
jgi:hypothetical protein